MRALFLVALATQLLPRGRSRDQPSMTPTYLVHPVTGDHMLFDVRAAGVDVEYRGREKPSDHTPTWIALKAA